MKSYNNLLLQYFTFIAQSQVMSSVNRNIKNHSRQGVCQKDLLKGESLFSDNNSQTPTFNVDNITLAKEKELKLTKGRIGSQFIGSIVKNINNINPINLNSINSNPINPANNHDIALSKIQRIDKDQNHNQKNYYQKDQKNKHNNDQKNKNNQHIKWPPQNYIHQVFNSHPSKYKRIDLLDLDNQIKSQYCLTTEYYLSQDSYSLNHSSINIDMKFFLKYNWKHLLILNISKSSIECEQFELFAQNLHHFKTLKALNIQKNFIKNISLQQLEKFINFKFINFGYHSNPFNLQTKTNIQTFKEKNSDIKTDIARPKDKNKNKFSYSQILKLLALLGLALGLYLLIRKFYLNKSISLNFPSNKLLDQLQIQKIQSSDLDVSLSKKNINILHQTKLPNLQSEKINKVQLSQTLKNNIINPLSSVELPNNQILQTKNDIINPATHKQLNSTIKSPLKSIQHSQNPFIQNLTNQQGKIQNVSIKESHQKEIQKHVNKTSKQNLIKDTITIVGTGAAVGAGIVATGAAVGAGIIGAPAVAVTLGHIALYKMLKRIF